MIFFGGALLNAITGGGVKAPETGGRLGFNPQYNLEQHNKRAVEGMKTLPRKVGQAQVVAMEKVAARRQQEAKLLAQYSAAVQKKHEAELAEYKTRAEYQTKMMSLQAGFAATDAQYVKASNESRFAQQVLEAQVSGYQQACDKAKSLIDF